MKILVLSYLFPNSSNPSYGIFVLNRIKAVHSYCDLKIINPIPWFPWIRSKNHVPIYEKYNDLDVYYPRFFSIPLIFKWLDFLFYFVSVFPVIFYIRFIKKFKFDIVDIHWTFPDLFTGWIISKFFRAKSVVTIRGKEAIFFKNDFLRKKFVDLLILKMNFVICLSKELQSDIHKIGFSEYKTKVILNGVDTEKFVFLEQEIAKKSLNLKISNKIIVSVGSLIERKGHHLIIQEMPMILEKYDVDLYIIGGVNPEGNYSAELRNMVTALKLDNVHFIDSLSHDQLVYWYNAADVFCLATSGEGCPNVVLEALACGCPVVVSNVGAVPDIIADGINGFIVTNKGLKLRKIIEKSLNHNWNRKKNSKMMKDKDWDSCAREVFIVYQDIILANRRK